MQPPYEASPTAYPCAWHPDRLTLIGCQRCGRPICPECANPAPVGFHCPDCTAAARANSQVRTVRSSRGVVAGLRAAPVTASLIGLNILVWVAVLLTGSNDSPLIDVLGLLPTAHCGMSDGVYVGVSQAACLAAQGTFFPGISDGAWWQLLTSAFLQIQPIHIGFNMLALWVLGPQLERFLGVARYAALYLVSALAGSVTVYWLADPTSTTLGASGAVFGLMGALFVVALRRGGDVKSVAVWLVINVVFTFTAGSAVSWQGHLGGLVGGAVTALIMVDLSRRGRLAWAAVGIIAAALIILTIVRTLTLS